MSSSALLVPSRSLDAQGVEGMLSPRGCMAEVAADCFGKSPKASLAEYLKPQFVSAGLTLHIIYVLACIYFLCLGVRGIAVHSQRLCSAHASPLESVNAV